MRITNIDLQCEDITWFAIDKNNNIAAFTSAGIGNVPEFVCKSKEDKDLLIDYFFNELTYFTQGKIIGDYASDSPMFDDCITLIKKGIFVYDIDENDNNKYVTVAIPKEPISLNQLPNAIKDILSDHLLQYDFSKDTTLTVKHAY